MLLQIIYKHYIFPAKKQNKKKRGKVRLSLMNKEVLSIAKP